MLHAACYTEGAMAELYLTRIMEGSRVSVHHFTNANELLILAQRFTLDMIYLGTTNIESGATLQLIDTVRMIKNHTYLAIIPTVLYYPQVSDTVLHTAYENGAEEVFSELVPHHIARIKTTMLIQRAFRDLSVNPSSRLPGPSIIEREIERQIEMEQNFAVCYADLDNFKAFNDYYGYYYGDRVIKLTSRIIKDVVFDLCREGFVGHIGGDDFIYVIPPELVESICKNIIRTFDLMIPYRYQKEDRLRGQIVTKNRRDVEETYGIMTLSIAVIINKGRVFKHVGEMSHMLADLKKYTKSLDGSNYMVERRQKY
ncbi:MAG: diguanylate cyclase [FCB group bacterium]|nr:diguanylate cyclase [FCB group bacterium]